MSNSKTEGASGSSPSVPRAMTPEQRAWRAYQDCDHDDEFSVCSDCVSAAFRSAEAEGRAAAMEERDAEWSKAVRASGLMLSPDSDNEAWAPLRALLNQGRDEITTSLAEKK